ncbi:hypothetical protein B0H13DRAFT_1923916 [Mycena leptocephala]|nr:hypothetical protein B0H13DRAFT_1923916 [Mycena leptocephala]
MSDSDDSQNEAQFGMTGGFQFVAYTLDVALWGAAMICEERSSGDSSRCKKLTNAKLIATNHIVLYAVQNYKDLILLFGNYEAQNVIILEKLLTAFCPPLVHRNEGNLTFYLPLTVIEVLRQSDLDVPRWVFVAPVVSLPLIRLLAQLAEIRSDSCWYRYAHAISVFGMAFVMAINRRANSLNFALFKP